MQKLQRSPWPKDFPPVEIVAGTSTTQGHSDYAAAKQGDIEAALRLVESLLTHLQIDQLCERYAQFNPRLTAVHAVEGFSVTTGQICRQKQGEEQKRFFMCYALLY